MSMTKKKDTTGTESEARKLRREMFSDEVLDELMSRTDERGVALTGEGGFLPEMIKAVLERGMGAELTDHLGYDRGDVAGNGSGNSRNGTTPKTIGTGNGLGSDLPHSWRSGQRSARSRVSDGLCKRGFGPEGD